MDITSSFINNKSKLIDICPITLLLPYFVLQSNIIHRKLLISIISFFWFSFLLKSTKTGNEPVYLLVQRLVRFFKTLIRAAFEIFSVITVSLLHLHCWFNCIRRNTSLWLGIRGTLDVTGDHLLSTLKGRADGTRITAWPQDSSTTSHWFISKWRQSGWQVTTLRRRCARCVFLTTDDRHALIWWCCKRLTWFHRIGHYCTWASLYCCVLYIHSLTAVQQRGSCCLFTQFIDIMIWWHWN